jgi:TRAP-type C4-dicarboxylate transport system permease small subunit
MKILKVLDKRLEEYFLVLSLVLLALVVFLQVVMRYVFQNSLSWSEEFARYLFLWQVWVGASYAAQKSRHLKVEALLTFLSARGRVVVELLATVVSIGFVIFLAYKSTEIAALVNATGQKTPALGIRMSIPYASVPVGMTLMLFRLAQNLYLVLRRLGTREVLQWE